MRRIAFVHAHPDDECLTTGGTMAKYAQEGAHVCLVTCTNGELGEVAEVPELGPVEGVRERLAEVRVEELAEACRRLGTIDLRLLGYHDSGMAGEPTNDDPKAFVRQDLDEAVARLVSILREVRPQVVVTYNEYGFYGHPDHIRAHEATVAAVERAADPSYGDGEPHQVAKLYWTAVPISGLQQVRDVFRSGDDDPGPEEEAFSDEEIERIGTDDSEIAAQVDVRPFVGRKFHALEAHRTQYGTTGRWLEMTEDMRELVMGTEFYVLARSTVGEPSSPEADLFERVDA